MHDILRLQRLVQQFANKVKTLLDRQEAGSADAEARHERHQEILDLAEATFKELSLQVNTAYPKPRQTPCRHGTYQSILEFAFSTFSCADATTLFPFVIPTVIPSMHALR